MKAKVAISKASEGASGLTGMWRVKRPIIDPVKCTKCNLCWLYCPESAMARGKQNEACIVYDYCKGCGICAEVCPAKAISIDKEV